MISPCGLHRLIWDKNLRSSIKPSVPKSLLKILNSSQIQIFPFLLFQTLHVLVEPINEFPPYFFARPYNITITEVKCSIQLNLKPIYFSKIVSHTMLIESLSSLFPVRPVLDGFWGGLKNALTVGIESVISLFLGGRYTH